MLFRGFVAVALLAIGIILSMRLFQEASVAGTLNPDSAVLGMPGAPAADALSPTIALAPLSLGNIFAADALKTRAPGNPWAADIPTTNTYRLTLRIGKGDTLASLLATGDVSREESHAAAVALATVYDPRRLKPGQDVVLDYRTTDGDGEIDQFIGFTLAVDFARQVTVTRRAEGGFTAAQSEIALIAKPTLARGTIDANLFDTATGAGVPVPVIVELIRAYSWDVDFQRNIHPGDTIEVLYERLFDEGGAPVHSGRILAASLTLGGTAHPIYLHTTKDGVTDYFDGNGRSARKALMRTPIDGARLSSGFGKRRHPILGYTKMHRGLDFAAARGTPIYAAGNGTVDYAGRNGAYGKYVRIRHNGRYTTAYAHMSRIKPGIRRGKRVTQGQIIGYVGTTGRSTGPHLHYEILAAGRRVNPLRIKMPSGRRLAGDELRRFAETRATTNDLVATLASTQVARKSD